MGIALNRLAQEDPSFRVKTDEESGKQLFQEWVNCTLKLLLTV
jgi:hypothetical protein